MDSNTGDEPGILPRQNTPDLRSLASGAVASRTRCSRADHGRQLVDQLEAGVVNWLLKLARDEEEERQHQDAVARRPYTEPRRRALASKGHAVARWPSLD